MSTWINRARAGRDAGAGEALQRSGTGLTDNQSSNSSTYGPFIQIPLRMREPNCPDHRLQLNSKCIYERRLPGNAYITCHVDRLQCGFYDSPSIHESSIEHVRFLTLHFVFHPSSTLNRFTGATIRVSVRNHQDEVAKPGERRRSTYEDAQLKKQSRQNPSIIRHAPHLLYGSISPETLQWNFNMAGTLGVSQGPANASLSPSGGVKSSYKRFEMMKIQGSIRTYGGNYGPDDDVEDGEVVWTLEENRLQKSGLPREFTFVILLQKGDPEIDTAFGLQIDPIVSSSFGHYPNWYMNLLPYRPLPKPAFDLDHEIGQKFEPVIPGRGYNFANLSVSFEDFISLPGTTYSASDPYGTASAQQNDTTKTPTAQSLQNSLTFGQATKLAGQGVMSQSQSTQQTAAQPVPQTTAQSNQNTTNNNPQYVQQIPQQIHQPIPQHYPQQSSQQAVPYYRAASVPPQLIQPWQAPTSLFTDNTLNVRVFVEKAASPVHSPSRVRDLSARRPHSLRHSRSREGLMSEYSTKAAEDAAQAYMQSNRTQNDALTHIHSTRKSAGHTDRRSFEDPNLAHDAALAHIQSTRRSMSSAGRNSFGGGSNRGSVRRSLAEEMKEMEARIRELTELEKQSKSKKGSPKDVFEYLDDKGNGLEEKNTPERRPRSTPARNRWSAPTTSQDSPTAVSPNKATTAAPLKTLYPSPDAQERKEYGFKTPLVNGTPGRRRLSSSVPPARNGLPLPGEKRVDNGEMEEPITNGTATRRRNSLSSSSVENEVTAPPAAELANGLLKESLSNGTPGRRRVSSSVPPVRNGLPLPGEKEIETGVYKDPPVAAPTPARRRYSVSQPATRNGVLAAIDKEVENRVLGPRLTNGSSPLKHFVFPRPKETGDV